MLVKNTGHAVYLAVAQVDVGPDEPVEVGAATGAQLVAQGWQLVDTVDAIVAWVGGHPGRAAQALDAEQARSKPRKSLIDALTGITAEAEKEQET